MKISIKSKFVSAIKKLFSYIRYILKTYYYKDYLYKDTFLYKYPKANNINLNNAPEIIYLFWMGDNELTDNRKVSIQSIQKNTKVKVELVTLKNLSKYILPNFPIHKAFKYLSAVHRSDYLRAYFMYHHGGGYTDIKEQKKSWKNAFNKLNNSPDKWALSYRELGAWHIANIKGKLGLDIKNNYLLLIGNAAFIYKPYSPLAKEWLEEVHNRLDNLYVTLKNNPATDPFGRNKNYPVPWAYLTGEIHQPLGLKYHDRLLKSRDLLPSLNNYR